MGLFDEIKKLTRPYDSEEYDFIDEAESVKPEPPAQRRAGPFSGFAGSQGASVRPSGGAAVVSSSPASPSVRPAPAARTAKQREGRVVSIAGNAAATQTQMILVKPVTFDDARPIADHLRDRHPIVLNLEMTPKDVSRRLLDFLSGVAYAQDGKIEPVASNTYMIMPYNVDLTGDYSNNFPGGAYNDFQSGGAYL